MGPSRTRAECRGIEVLGEPYEGKLQVRFDEGVLETVRIASECRVRPLRRLRSASRQHPTLQLRNLQNHCPADVYPQVKDDYHKIVEAKSQAEAKEAYKAFVRKWEKELPQVTRSLEEAGEELLTFYAFPPEQWKSLKTTNPIERLNLEFKRRVKTQCSLPSEKSAILILYGLLLSGQIRFRKIDGWHTIVKVVADGKEELKKRAS